MLGAAVIGLGVGAEHARAYARAPGCALRSVYDHDAKRIQQVLAEIGQGVAAASLEAVLGDSAVDLVSIASYDDAHFAEVLASLRAGKHVFSEKPMCRSLDELTQIRQAWRHDRGRHLGCNLVLRAAPLYQWLRRAIAAGELGTIYGFDGDYLYGRLSKITDGWRKDVEGYSVMQGGGVHLVDLMLWLTAQRPVSVAAMGNRICTDGTDFRYHDFVAATFQFESGLVGRVSANFGCMHRHQHVVRVFGTKATFLYDDAGPRLHTSRDPSIPARPLALATLPDSKGALIPGFVQGIVDEQDPSEGARHEFDVMTACLAADRALAAGRATRIEYDD